MHHDKMSEVKGLFTDGLVRLSCTNYIQSVDKIDPHRQPEKKNFMFIKKIKFLVCSYDIWYTFFEISLMTEDGEIYSWCQPTCKTKALKDNFEEQKMKAFFINNNKIYYWRNAHMPLIDWSNIHVVKTAINRNNTLVLTDDGKVYCCYLRRVYIWMNFLHKLEKQMHINETITCIACSSQSYVVLTDKGDMYEWTIIFDEIDDEPEPRCFSEIRKVKEISAKTVVKVVSGYDHTLVLTDKGEVYGWGCNRFEQLAFNDGRAYTPFINIPNIKKVSDIAAMDTMSAFKSSEDGLIYMQGRLIKWSDSNYFAVCEYTNIFDICNSNQSQMDHKYTDDEFTILRDLETAFNNRSTSDLTIQVKRKFIYVHKYILKRRSSYFESMFRFNGLENRQRIIKYDDHSYAVYKAFFKYLYTGVINLSSLEDKLELLKLSNKYCVTNLERDCIQTIKKDMTLSNVLFIKELAINYNIQKLEKLCIEIQLYQELKSYK